MKHTFTLVLLAAFVAQSLAQWSYREDYLPGLILDASTESSGIPPNYTDYSFDWNAQAGKWDSAEVDYATYYGSADMLNLRISTFDRENGELSPGDWIETYNIQMQEYSELDPLAGYTYFPCDSMHAVITTPWFGRFGISSYYESSADGKLASEESFMNDALLGIPSPRFWLGKSVSEYDAYGQLFSYNVDYQGIDSTRFFYNSEGQLVRALEMLGYGSNAIDEYSTRDFYYDAQGRLSATVTTYYVDSLNTFDLKDSLAYSYGDGKDYVRTQYGFDIPSETYKVQSRVDYIFEGDTVEIVDLVYYAQGVPYLFTRYKSTYDDEGNFVKRLTLEGGSPSSQPRNSRLTVRYYETTTSISQVKEIEQTQMKWWQEGSTLRFKFNTELNGKIMLYGIDGSFIDKLFSTRFVG